MRRRSLTSSSRSSRPRTGEGHRARPRDRLRNRHAVGRRDLRHVRAGRRVDLPRRPAALGRRRAGPGRASGAPGGAANGSEGVLLAEDEETIRRLVGEVLTRSGYKVFAAPNGDEAIQLLDGARRRDRPAPDRRRDARNEGTRPGPRCGAPQPRPARSLHLRLHERAGRGVRGSGRRLHRQALLAQGARLQGARSARRGRRRAAARRGSSAR